MILLTGGSKCGKSTYAEKLCLEYEGPHYYIASMEPYGKESEEKIAYNRRIRADKWTGTIECYKDLQDIKLPQKGTALLECICNLTANELFDDEGHYKDPFEKIITGIRTLKEHCSTLIVITNEVGSEGTGYPQETTEYMSVIGRINSSLTEMADEAYEMVCGIPCRLK